MSQGFLDAAIELSKLEAETGGDYTTLLQEYKQRFASNEQSKVEFSRPSEALEGLRHEIVKLQPRNQSSFNGTASPNNNSRTTGPLDGGWKLCSILWPTFFPSTTDS